MSAYKMNQARALEICRTALSEIAHLSRSTLRGIAQDALHVTAEIKLSAFCGDCGQRQTPGLTHACSLQPDVIFKENGVTYKVAAWTDVDLLARGIAS